RHEWGGHVGGLRVSEIDGVQPGALSPLRDDDGAPPVVAQHAVQPAVVVLPFVQQPVLLLWLTEGVVEELLLYPWRVRRLARPRGRRPHVEEPSPVVRPADHPQRAAYDIAALPSGGQLAHV